METSQKLSDYKRSKEQVELELLILLKNQLVSFMDDLIESFPLEPDFVIFRIFIKDRLPIAEIMKYIVKNILPLANMIHDKNADFCSKKKRFI